MKKVIVFCTLLLALFFQQAAAFTNRYTADGKTQYWDAADLPIQWTMNQDGSKHISSISMTETIFKKSFAAWDSIGNADIAFEYMGQTSWNKVQQDESNLIIFDTNTDGYTVSANAGPSVIGITISTFYSSGSQVGRIIDADIIFNDDAYKFTVDQPSDLGQNLVNLQDVATHEIGHLLGLDHTYIEEATMWPYARTGQSTIHADDQAGVASIYPSESWETDFKSINGTVREGTAGLFGIYVTAYPQTAEAEEVAAITNSSGQFSIIGLDPSENYYLQARTVDLDHLGPYISDHGNRTAFIPLWYDNASRINEAVAISPGTLQSIDFSLKEATLVAEYDQDYVGTSTVITPNGAGPVEYMAVRFPAEDLPESFNVYSVSFYNWDGNMVWPRIFLTTGEGTQPDLGNSIRSERDYVGKEQALSTVEWEIYSAKNTRDLWVVFEVPDIEFDFNARNGPGIIAEAFGTFYNNSFYTRDGGKTFQPISLSTSVQKYDFIVYLTVDEVENVTVGPQLDIPSADINFEYAKIGTVASKILNVTNTGDSDLQITDMYTESPAYFQVSMDSRTVPSGETEQLKVSFTPKALRAYSSVLTIVSNDPAATGTYIDLAGSGAYPVADSPTQSIDFGETEVGTPVSGRFYVFSDGIVPLKLQNFVSSTAEFYAEQDSLEVAPNDSGAVAVVFDPAEAGEFSGVLLFATDDPDHVSFSVALSGSASGGSTPAVFCDFNGDGNINISDVIALLLFQRATPGDLGGDFNGDGVSNISDAIAMLLAQRNGNCPDSQTGAQ